MNKRIEQEINKTLQCFDGNSNIQVSSLFAENLSSRIANIKVSRGIGYRSRVFYPAVIILLLVLNFSACLVSFKGRQLSNNASDSSASVLASEYGIGQSNIAF